MRGFSSGSHTNAVHEVVLSVRFVQPVTKIRGLVSVRDSLRVWITHQRKFAADLSDKIRIRFPFSHWTYTLTIPGRNSKQVDLAQGTAEFSTALGLPVGWSGKSQSLQIIFLLSLSLERIRTTDAAVKQSR